MPAVDLEPHIADEVSNSELGVINDPGRGVAAYQTADGRHRVDIYIGLELDGVTLYRNISEQRPDIVMQFALQPVVSCQHRDLDFNPNTDTLITIEVGAVLNIIQGRVGHGLDPSMDWIGLDGVR